MYSHQYAHIKYSNSENLWNCAAALRLQGKSTVNVWYISFQVKLSVMKKVKFCTDLWIKSIVLCGCSEYWCFFLFLYVTEKSVVSGIGCGSVLLSVSNSFVPMVDFSVKHYVTYIYPLLKQLWSRCRFPANLLLRVMTLYIMYTLIKEINATSIFHAYHTHLTRFTVVFSPRTHIVYR